MAKTPRIDDRPYKLLVALPTSRKTCGLFIPIKGTAKSLFIYASSWSVLTNQIGIYQHKDHPIASSHGWVRKMFIIENTIKLRHVWRTNPKPIKNYLESIS